MRLVPFRLLSIVCCFVGTALVLSEVIVKGDVSCHVNCYNGFDYCDGAYGTNDCTRFILPQGEMVHAPASHGSSRTATGVMNNVWSSDWGAGLCDDGGSQGLYYEICTCAGNWTHVGYVAQYRCGYGGSS